MVKEQITGECERSVLVPIGVVQDMDERCTTVVRCVVQVIENFKVEVGPRIILNSFLFDLSQGLEPRCAARRRT